MFRSVPEPISAANPALTRIISLERHLLPGPSPESAPGWGRLNQIWLGWVARSGRNWATGIMERKFAASSLSMSGGENMSWPGVEILWTGLGRANNKRSKKERERKERKGKERKGKGSKKEKRKKKTETRLPFGHNSRIFIHIQHIPIGRVKGYCFFTHALSQLHTIRPKCLAFDLDHSSKAIFEMDSSARPAWTIPTTDCNILNAALFSWGVLHRKSKTPHHHHRKEATSWYLHAQLSHFSSQMRFAAAPEGALVLL